MKIERVMWMSLGTEFLGKETCAKALGPKMSWPEPSMAITRNLGFMLCEMKSHGGFWTEKRHNLGPNRITQIAVRRLLCQGRGQQTKWLQ